MSPYIPGLNPALSFWLIALVMNILLSQITGLEMPRPGIAFFHLTLSILLKSNESGRFALSRTPEASFPRYDVHCLSGFTWHETLQIESTKNETTNIRA